jgi:MFS family permease
LATITTSFLVVGTISVAGVVIVRQIIDVETSRYGVLMSALGIGMMIGVPSTRYLGNYLDRTWLAVTGVSLMAMGVITLPWSQNLTIAALLAAIIGVGMLMVQISSQTTLQTISPEMRGRLLGISQTLSGSATFLASALTGLLIGYLNVTFVMGGVGILALAIAIVVAFYHHAIK